MLSREYFVICFLLLAALTFKLSKKLGCFVYKKILGDRSIICVFCFINIA